MGFDFGAVWSSRSSRSGSPSVESPRPALVGPKFPNAEKAIHLRVRRAARRGAWFNFNPRFYIVALVFVIFEVDIALTFPVVAVFQALGRGEPGSWPGSRSSSSSSSSPSWWSAWCGSGRHGDLEWVKNARRASGDEQPLRPRAATAAPPERRGPEARTQRAARSSSGGGRLQMAATDARTRRSAATSRSFTPASSTT